MTDGASVDGSHVVHVLVGDESFPVAIGAQECVLVGREPDPGRLPRDAAPQHLIVRTWSVPSPSVSTNHLLIWRDGAAFALRDLASKNGTWIRLRDNPMGFAGPCTVRLAAPRTAPCVDDLPSDASWCDVSDFARAISIAVNAWLQKRNLPARATLDARGAAEPGCAVPLADGRALRVTLNETVDSIGPSLLESVWRYVERQKAVARLEEETQAEGMILASPAIRKALARVVDAAGRGLRLMLIGPSGAGKEGLARCYHRHSRGSGPFVARNCSQLRGEFLRSELFGAEAGAFTGCVHRIVGAVERAHGGTLFLDEVGDMSEDVQPMLLRFLDDGVFERMGAYGKSQTANVGVVCATNKDLRAAVLTREFRADLWYRLAIEVVEVPPLRERPADVVAYLKSRSLPSGGSAWAMLTPRARDLLATYPWEGNFRELANFVACIPSDAKVDEIDYDVCAELLSRGALQQYSSSPRAIVTEGDVTWGAVVARAIAAFTEDYGVPPRRWDDVKDCLEKYPKPLLFAHLSGATCLRAFSEARPQALATAVDADRGTALKQLSRYFERFAR